MNALWHLEVPSATAEAKSKVTIGWDEELFSQVVTRGDAVALILPRASSHNGVGRIKDLRKMAVRSFHPGESFVR